MFHANGSCNEWMNAATLIACSRSGPGCTDPHRTGLGSLEHGTWIACQVLIIRQMFTFYGAWKWWKTLNPGSLAQHGNCDHCASGGWPFNRIGSDCNQFDRAANWIMSPVERMIISASALPTVPIRFLSGGPEWCPGHVVPSIIMLIPVPILFVCDLFNHVAVRLCCVTTACHPTCPITLRSWNTLKFGLPSFSGLVVATGPDWFDSNHSQLLAPIRHVSN